MLRLWRIVPAARPEDTRWQDRTIWSEVVVAAETAALARLVAAEFESDQARRSGRVDLDLFRTGFDDEKLYHVAGIDQPGPSDRLPAGPAVLRATRLDEATGPR